MPRIDVTVEAHVSRSGRARQLEAMFDVPRVEVSRLSWRGDVPLEGADPWSVGLIVGPSGAGKSTLLRHLFGSPLEFEWRAQSVIDDFAPALSIDEVSTACQAVGFNTIPAWLRPFSVLSTGERFRVELARRLLETVDGPIVIDEFTSVVDRQVAKIGAHAVQKWARRRGRQAVCATCHYDVVEWLQPDWILEPATMTFTRRTLQRRPALDAVIQRVPHTAWDLFAPFHYLTRDLHRSAQCFVLFAEGQPASFAGMLHRPHATVDDIIGCSRLVTLPDWQGLGAAMILVDALGAAYRAIGKRLRTYPAHPALIRSFAASPRWVCVKEPGTFSRRGGGAPTGATGAMGGRPNAVYEYRGPAEGDGSRARALLEGRAA